MQYIYIMENTKGLNNTKHTEELTFIRGNASRTQIFD